MTTTEPTPASTPMTGPQASVYQQLRGHLATLKLTAAAEHLPSVLAEAEAQGWSMTATLEHLLGREVEATEARKLAGRLRFASLPTPATLADFDFDAAPGLDPKLINELATCRYLETATNVLLIGPPVIAGLGLGPTRSCRSRRCCDRCNVGGVVADAGSPSGELSSQIEVLAVGLLESVPQGLDVMSMSFLQLVDLGGQGEHERAFGVRRGGWGRVRAGSGAQMFDPAA